MEGKIQGCCETSDYAKKLKEELEAMGSSEMWRAGKTVRSLRADRQS
jgi:hypothetical protein